MYIIISVPIRHLDIYTILGYVDSVAILLPTNLSISPSAIYTMDKGSGQNPGAGNGDSSDEDMLGDEFAAYMVAKEQKLPSASTAAYAARFGAASSATQAQAASSTAPDTEERWMQGEVLSSHEPVTSTSATARQHQNTQLEAKRGPYSLQKYTDNIGGKWLARQKAYLCLKPTSVFHQMCASLSNPPFNLRVEGNIEQHIWNALSERRHDFHEAIFPVMEADYEQARLERLRKLRDDIIAVYPQVSLALKYKHL